MLTGWQKKAHLPGWQGYMSRIPATGSRPPESGRFEAAVWDCRPADPGILEVHAEADLRQPQGERNALIQCLADGATEAEILAAAGQALEAYWGLLDGVCAESGV